MMSTECVEAFKEAIGKRPVWQAEAILAAESGAPVAAIAERLELRPRRIRRWLQSREGARLWALLRFGPKPEGPGYRFHDVVTPTRDADDKLSGHLRCNRHREHVWSRRGGFAETDQ